MSQYGQPMYQPPQPQYVVTRILWLLTWGLFGIGTLVDLFTIPAQTRQVNTQIAAGVR